MLAEENKYIESAAKELFFKTQDEDVLRLCRKMDEEIEGDRRRAERLAELEERNAELEDKLAHMQAKMEELEKQIQK